MKWLDDDRIRVLVIGVFVGLVLGSGTANADFILGTPMNLGPLVNSSSYEYSPDISADGLSLYFHANNRPGGYGKTDLWVTTRPTIEDPWCEAQNLGPVVNSTFKENNPCISDDNLELYFNSGRPGGSSVFVSRRATEDDPWGEPISIVDCGAGSSPSLSAEGLELYSHVGPWQNHEIVVCRRTSTEESWAVSEVLPTPPNTSIRESDPDISSDGLALFFDSGDLEAATRNIWVSTRSTRQDPWGSAFNIGPTLYAPLVENAMPSVWAEGLEVYFHSTRQPDGTPPIGAWPPTNIWKAPIIPIVDLNGDGIVDAEDMCIMVDNWGTDNKLCDIGPMPWGDGIVDVQDLIVLAEHLFEEFPPVQ